MCKKTGLASAIWASLIILGACSTPSADVDCTTITEANTDACLRLNHIQVLGTHNSYKLNLPESLITAVNAFVPGWSENIEYGHRPLTEQLELLGIRQFELDVFADTSGGLFARPAGALLSGDTDFIDQPEMMEPGFKMLHVQDIDYRSTCLTLVSCLKEVRDWSVQHPSHFPIMLMIEVKDSPATSRGNFALTSPISVDHALMMQIDEEIYSVFAREHVITPDDVRGTHATLEEAILESGWPTLAQSRGRVLFALDNTGRHRDEYLRDSDILEGRAMFVSSPPGYPSAGFVKMNNVFTEFDDIQTFVEAGFIVRTRSDIPNQEAKTGSTERRDLALQSGAQYVSTDYPEESPFGSGFIVTLPGAVSAARCNPVSAPAGCEHRWLRE